MKLPHGALQGTDLWGGNILELFAQQLGFTQETKRGPVKKFYLGKESNSQKLQKE